MRWQETQKVHYTDEGSARKQVTKMDEKKYKKLRQVLAIIGIVLLVGMYIVSFIAALGHSENAHAIFMLSMYCTFVVPVIIYIIQVIYKMANKKNDRQE